MVLFNYSTRELTAKIVFYGPGLCGKTTNLQYIHSTLPDNVKGKMLSLATKTDRTLFFDFLPIDLGQIRGMKTRVQLYTVPGQVFYNETRKLVLKGADGIVFVADSQATMLGANVESFKNLEENLKAHGLKLAEMPHVLQFNKRDLPRLASIEELNAAINRFNAPFYESVATTGIGVQDTLKAITKLVLLHLTKKYDPKTAAAAAAPPQPPISVAAAPRPEAPTAPRQVETPRARPIPPPPPASPAQTMQMPAASLSAGRLEGPRSIPLSSPGAPHPTGRPMAPSFGEELTLDVPAPAAQAEPSFADEEIQELVDEVQDSELSYDAGSFGSVGFGHTSVGATAPVPFDSVQAEPEPQVAWPEPATERVPPTRAPEPRRATGGGAGGGLGFEIDHGIDPDWSTASASADLDSPPMESLGGSVGENVWDLGVMDDEASSDLDAVPSESPSRAEDRADTDLPGEDLPRLTEVVADHELFSDPGLDVARMVPGEEREVIVPVEFQDADRQMRRFKLSIRLRMESVD